MSKNTGSIKIETDRYVKGSERFPHRRKKYRRITKISGIRKLKALPHKYVESGEFMFYEKGVVKVGTLVPRETTPEDKTKGPETKMVIDSIPILSVGDDLSEDNFQIIYNKIKSYGHRLFQINKFLKMENEFDEWMGPETLRI